MDAVTDVAPVADRAYGAGDLQTTKETSAEACRRVCRENGWDAGDAELRALVQLREELQQGHRSEWLMDRNRLAYVRWLVQQGHFTDGV